MTDFAGAGVVGERPPGAAGHRSNARPSNRPCIGAPGPMAPALGSPLTAWRSTSVHFSPRRMSAGSTGNYSARRDARVIPGALTLDRRKAFVITRLDRAIARNIVLMP